MGVLGEGAGYCSQVQAALVPALSFQGWQANIRTVLHGVHAEPSLEVLWKRGRLMQSQSSRLCNNVEQSTPACKHQGCRADKVACKTGRIVG